MNIELPPHLPALATAAAVAIGQARRAAIEGPDEIDLALAALLEDEQA